MGCLLSGKKIVGEAAAADGGGDASQVQEAPLAQAIAYGVTNANPMFPWEEGGLEYTWSVAQYTMSTKMTNNGWSVTRPDPTHRYTFYFRKRVMLPVQAARNGNVAAAAPRKILPKSATKT